MAKIKKIFWKIVLDIGDIIGNIGDSILMRAYDRLNDISKIEWLKTYNEKENGS